MPTWAAGSEPARISRGFTLIELLVVVAIVAIATAGVGFALRDSAYTLLDREAQRLASLLDAARAQSRASGRTVLWVPTTTGFRFDGLPADALPGQWLHTATRAATATPLVLGPEPVIAPQEVTLVSASDPSRRVRIATDGLRPFAIQASP